MLPRWYRIRWKLPLSYAAVALLAALVLGAILLTILRGYYNRQETAFMLDNARSASSLLATTLRYTTDTELISRQLNSLAVFNGTRITLEDLDGQLLADTGRERPLRISIPNATVWRELNANQDGNNENVITIFEVEPRNNERPPNPNRPRPPRNADELAPQNAPEFIIPAPDALPPNYSIELDGVQTLGTHAAVDSAFVFSASPSIGGGFNIHTEEINTTQTKRSDQAVRVSIPGPNDQILGTLTVSEGPAYGDDIIRSVTDAWIFASGAAVLLAAGIGWLASLHLSKPLQSLTETTTRMADGDLSARVRLNRQDELGTLADSYNHMADRIEGTVNTLKRFVADAAHEIHTPLTALRTNLELTAERHDPAVNRQALAQVQRLQALADNLLDLSRLEANGSNRVKAPLDLTALLYGLSEVYASRAEQADLDFLLDAGPVPTISADENQITRMMANLLDNAIKFTPAGGTITASLHHKQDQVVFSVTDTGIGIPPDEIDGLFERFHRGRNTANYPGSGLGLAIVKAIVVAHGGQVSATSDSNGTRITVTLPAQP